MRVRMVCYKSILLTTCYKRGHVPYLCDNLYCKLAFESRVLVPLVVRGLCVVY